MQETRTRPDWLMFTVGFASLFAGIVAVVNWSIGLALVVVGFCGAFAMYRRIRPFRP